MVISERVDNRLSGTLKPFKLLFLFLPFFVLNVQYLMTCLGHTGTHSLLLWKMPVLAASGG